MSSKIARQRSNTAPDRKRNSSRESEPLLVPEGYNNSQGTQEERREDMLDAKTAALMLGVKTQTLYAYVSRGLIRTAPRRGTQASLYHREDVEAVRLNGRSGNFSGDPSERFIRWGGGGVLQTAITSIDAAGPRYRGKLAVDLANMDRPFEDCVELLWSGILPSQSVVWQPAYVPESFLDFIPSIIKLAKKTNSRQMLALTVGAYAASVGRNPETALGAPVLAGRQLIQILAPTLGLLRTRPRYTPSSKPESIAAIIAESVGAPRTDQILRALNACLILSADHELAPSTFTSRIAASAGADIFSCVNSAFGTFEGALTGFGCDESEKTLRSAASPKEYVTVLEEYIRRKEHIPGYNHPLYPAGDPRALHLIELARDINSDTPIARHVLNCIDTATKELEVVPSLAAGLVAIAAALDMPKEMPGAMMAIGRVSGWIAHSFEQRLAGFLIRPRTRYIGPLE
jgi:citrate synthase